MEPQPGYWQDLERRLAFENARDKAAARATNAAFLLVNAVPFGTPRSEQ